MVKKSTKCENCGHDIELEIKESQPQQVTFEIPTVSASQPAQTQVMQAPPVIPPTPAPEPKKEEKKLTHDEISAMIPKGVNSMDCPGDDCNHKRLKNPTQTRKYKSCPECEANTLTKDSKYCPYCSKNLEEEELEGGIELEQEEE